MPISEHFWFQLFLKEFNVSATDEIVINKPLPIRWAAYFIQCLSLNEELGWDFSKKCVSEYQQVMGENLSALEELILEGDLATSDYQIDQLLLKSEADAKPMHEMQKSALHFAVIGGNMQMVKLVLEKGFLPLINRDDYITGFTPFHLAIFIQKPELMWHLITSGSDVTKLDNYDGSPFDYARLLGLLPYPADKKRDTFKLKLFEQEKNAIVDITVQQFESTFNVKWTPYPKCDLDYIEELMFSGFTLEKDMTFREKYNKLIYESSGDENLILAKISDQVGYGVYAKKEFNVGDFIVRYGGFVSKKNNIPFRSYFIFFCFGRGFLFSF
eukprot:TRINITY_DN3289_c0_g1_i2.p1 TRINITY_DN3289_c0_g1~~TRINITY_DN3289_c0_g1_i2.p1  ORF type:complete len:328 (+),score=45.27 TRINITY_DN3289_c0_g1_i2:57-1040(+)